MCIDDDIRKVIKLARSLRICIIDYRTNSIDFHIEFFIFFCFIVDITCKCLV